MMATGEPGKVFRKEMRYGHEVERVWAALTNAEALAQWLMPNNFVPELGRKFEFRIDPMMGMSVVACEVLDLVAPDAGNGWHGRMAWSWPVPRRSKNTGAPRPPMRVEWTVEPDGAGGTVLTLTQSGLEGMSWIFRKMMTSGWGTMMKRWLPRVLDTFERGSDGALRYRRMERAPNRGHHGTKTVPEGFAK